MELHKEIAAWLAKFKFIQANSKALTPNAEIEDLVAIIRDGVVLCQVKQMVDAYYVFYYIKVMIYYSKLWHLILKHQFSAGSFPGSWLPRHDKGDIRHKCTW